MTHIPGKANKWPDALSRLRAPAKSSIPIELLTIERTPVGTRDQQFWRSIGKTYTCNHGWWWSRLPSTYVRSGCIAPAATVTPGSGPSPSIESGTSAGLKICECNAPACFAFDVDPVRTKESDFRSRASGRVAQGRRLRVARRARSPIDRSPRDQANKPRPPRSVYTDENGARTQTSGWVPPPALLKLRFTNHTCLAHINDPWASPLYYSDPSWGSPCTS